MKNAFLFFFNKIYVNSAYFNLFSRKKFTFYADIYVI